jgi:hypothetical protein
VRNHALVYRETLADLVRRTNRPEAAPGMDPNFVLLLHDGYRVVLTQEQQVQPLGWCWHLSTSIGDPDAYPNPEAVNAILQFLEIARDWRQAAHVNLEGGVIEFWFKYRPENETASRSAGSGPEAAQA